MRRFGSLLSSSFLPVRILHSAAGPGTVAPEPSPPPNNLVCAACEKAFRYQTTYDFHLKTRHASQLFTTTGSETGVQDGSTGSSCNETIQRPLGLTQQLQLRLEAVKKELSRVVSNDHTSGQQQATSVGDVSEWGESRVAARCSSQSVPLHVVRSWGSSAARSGWGVGTGISRWMGIGQVRGDVKTGHLLGHRLQAAKDTPSGTSVKTEEGDTPAHTPSPSLPNVVEFVLETYGYNERMPGQMASFRNDIRVRVIDDPAIVDGNAATRGREKKTVKKKRTKSEAPTASPTSVLTSPRLSGVARGLREGNVVRVSGQYCLHASYDPISRRLVENAIVEADQIEVLQRS